MSNFEWDAFYCSSVEQAMYTLIDNFILNVKTYDQKMLASDLNRCVYGAGQANAALIIFGAFNAVIEARKSAPPPQPVKSK